MADLEKATRPEPRGPVAGDAGTVVWDVLLDEQWRIGPKMHGGYLIAVLARAAVETVASRRPEHADPQAVTATYLRAPDPGPAVLTVDVLRSGRGVSQLRTRLDQDGPCVEAAVTLGTLPGPSDDDVSPAPVALAPFADCPRSPSDGGDGRGTLPIMDVVDVRLDPASTGFLRGRPSGAGRLSGWVAVPGEDAWTSSALLVALDVLPPATFDLGLSGWSPTMSLSAHVHAHAAPGPLRATQWVDHASADRMHESCWIWDAGGRLVGQSNQLAAIRR